MKSARWLIALLALATGTAEASAQVCWPPPGLALGGIAVSGGGFGFAFRGRNVRVAGGFGFYNQAYISPYLYNPYAPVYGFPVVPPVTVININPPPQIVIAPVVQPVAMRGGDLGGLEQALRQRQIEQLEEAFLNGRPLPGVPAGGFRPVQPEDRARAQQPIKPEAPKPEAGKPKPPQPKPPELPMPPKPAADPKAENARLTILGKEAFRAREYGRAVERFRQATVVAPAEPEAYFLLAQALFALAKYPEAVDAIHAGLRRQPDWPRLGFRPLDLYGLPMAAFPEQLRNLAEALDRHPGDVVLLFLYAYQLWFDGRQEEAVRLFERAAAIAADRSVIDLFLRAKPRKPDV